MDCNIMKLIGTRINTALAYSEKKQKELAQYLGVTDNTVSYWCNGSRTPNTEQIIGISKYLKVSASYLLGADVPPTNDIKVSAICEYTGLSEEAVTRLNEWERNNSGVFFPKRKDFLNTLLTSECIEAVCLNAENYKEDMQLAIKYLKEWKLAFEEKDKSKMIDKEDKADELLYRMEFPQFRASKHIISLFEQFAEPDKSEYESLNIFYQKNRITVEER